MIVGSTLILELEVIVVLTVESGCEEQDNNGGKTVEWKTTELERLTKIVVWF